MNTFSVPTLPRSLQAGEPARRGQRPQVPHSITVSSVGVPRLSRSGVVRRVTATRSVVLTASPVVCAWVIRDMAQRFRVVRHSARWEALQSFADDLQALGVLTARKRGK